MLQWCPVDMWPAFVPRFQKPHVSLAPIWWRRRLRGVTSDRSWRLMSNSSRFSLLGSSSLLQNYNAGHMGGFLIKITVHAPLNGLLPISDWKINVAKGRQTLASAPLQHGRSQGRTCSRWHVWISTALPLKARHTAHTSSQKEREF